MKTEKNKVAAVESEVVGVMPVIEAYVALKKKIKKLEEQAKADYEQFASAASAIDANKMIVAGARIELSHTPKKWEYSRRIVKEEEALKELKVLYQQKHEPVSGGEEVWKVVTKA